MEWDKGTGANFCVSEQLSIVASMHISQWIISLFANYEKLRSKLWPQL